MNWPQVYSILSQLLDTPEQDRGRRMKELCGFDAALNEAVSIALREALSAETALGFERPVQRIMQQIVSESKAVAPSRSGQSIKHFYIQKLVGRGGQGEVYKAWDEKLERPVAIKFLSTRQSISEKALEQFQQEARAIASVEHPHICRLYSVESTDEGLPFLVMEMIDGNTLAEKIERDHPIDPIKAMEICSQICKGLRAAHERKLIHQDIKPSNILLAGPSETVKITDFGIAKWARLHQSKNVGGTLPYMSPEQLRGEDVDYRTDIWSLGVVLYELAGGTNLLKKAGLTVAECKDIVLNGTPFPQLDKAHRLQNIYSRCLEKDRDDRFRSIAALEDHLPLRQINRRISFHAVVLPVVLVLISMIAAFAIYKIKETPAQPVETFALMWTEDQEGAQEKEWINFQLETILLRLQQTAEWNGPQLALVDHIRGITSPERVFDKYETSQVIALSFLPVDGQNVLRMRLIDTSTSSVIDAGSIAITDLNYSTSHKLIKTLLELIGAQTDDRSLYFILYNSSAEPEAIELFESAQALLKEGGGMEGVDTAIKLLNSSIEMDSSFALSYSWLADAYLQRYDFYQSVEDLYNANTADSLANLFDDTRVLRYTSFVSQGLFDQTRGRYNKALEMFETAIAFDPSQSVAFVGAAESMARLDRQIPAERRFHEALSLDRNDTEVLMAIGIFKYDFAQYDSAAFYFKRIIELDPLHKAAHRNLGASYENMNLLSLAQQSYEKALQIEPDYVTYNNLAYLHYLEEDFTSAIEEWNKAIELNPDIHYLWGGLGFSYNNYPDSSIKRDLAFKKAIALAESLRAINSNDISVLISLSEYHLELQDTSNSRFFWQQLNNLPIPPDLKSDFDLLSNKLTN